MITKTFKLTIATDTEEQMQKEEEHLSMTYGAEEVEEENIEIIEVMRAVESKYKDATALLEIALWDIERLLNTPLEKCKDLAKFRTVCFMGGTLELPNVWRYADEARELIDKGKVNKTYNSCAICGKQISPYKQVCHACETKYEIRLGDSIMEKVHEYVKKLEGEQNERKRSS